MYLVICSLLAELEHWDIAHYSKPFQWRSTQPCEVAGSTERVFTTVSDTREPLGSAVPELKYGDPSLAVQRVYTRSVLCALNISHAKFHGSRFSLADAYRIGTVIVTHNGVSISVIGAGRAVSAAFREDGMQPSAERLFVIRWARWVCLCMSALNVTTKVDDSRSG